jgi:predicted Zn-dependent protease with MMP-like domain
MGAEQNKERNPPSRVANNPPRSGVKKPLSVAENRPTQNIPRQALVVNRQKQPNRVVVRRGNGRPPARVSNFPLTPQPRTIYVLVSPNQIPQQAYYYNQPVFFVHPQYIQPQVQPHVVYQAPLHQLQQQLVVQAPSYVANNPQALRVEVPIQIRNLSEKPILEKKEEEEVKKEVKECNNVSESEDSEDTGSDSDSELELDQDSDSDSDDRSSKLKAVALAIAEKNYQKQICEDFVFAIQFQDVLDDDDLPPPKPKAAPVWKFDDKPSDQWSYQLQISKEDIIALYQSGEDVSGLINVYLGEHPEEAEIFGKQLEDAVSSFSIMFNVKTYTPKKPDPPEEIFEIDYLGEYDSDGLSDDDDDYLDMNYVDEQ